MEPNIITADDARAMLAQAVEWTDRDGRLHVQYTNIRLALAAPDLAATVVAQATEIDSLTRELAAARAIIDGRTTPPTGEEIALHCGTGGRWRSIAPGEFILSTGDGDAEDARQTAAVQRANAVIVMRAGVRWWAIDAQGRCCAWPVVAPKGGV